MGHIGLLGTILAFGMGVAAVTHGFHLYKRSSHPFLKNHILLFTFLNLVVFFGLIFNYLQLNASSLPLEKAGRFIPGVYHLALSILTVITIFFLVSLILPLIQIKWTTSGKTLFLGSFGLLTSSQAVFLPTHLQSQGIPLYSIFFLIIIISFFLTGILLSILLFFRSTGTSIPKQTKQLRILAIFLCYSFCSAILLNSFHLTETISLAAYLILMAGLITFINLIPIIRLKGFIQILFPQALNPISAGEINPEFFKKYRISSREQDIIRLICSGKSSKEIEQALFISSHTVKEHIYRIYKKTGIKNRVQLVNLIREH